MPTSNSTAALQELIAAAAKGNRHAQNALLEHYWPLIRRVVHARKSRLGPKLSRREETADLQQETALRILKNLPAHEFRSTNAFAAWIRKIAENQVTDAFRHQRAKKRDMQADTALSHAADIPRYTRGAETRMDERDRAALLMKQIDGLKPEYGAALVMFHMGFPHAEIAETLGCTVEAARKLVTRAHKKLTEMRMNERVG